MGVNPQGEYNPEFGQYLGLSPQIDQARPWHQSMARCVVFAGARPMDLCRQFGYTPGQISRIMGSPAFQAECARLRTQVEEANLDMRKEMQILATKATMNLHEDLHIGVDQDHKAREIRQRASLEVLGMAGVRQSGGHSGINILIDNSRRTAKEVDELGLDELRNEVHDLCLGEDGTFE